VSGPQHRMTWPAHRRVAFWRSRRLSNIRRAPRRCACKMARPLEKKNHSPRSAGSAAGFPAKRAETIGRVSK
jgi:hypothetical protein